MSAIIENTVGQVRPGYHGKPGALQLKIFFYLLSIACVLGLASWLTTGNQAATAVSPTHADTGFAVVELFTSEGCSSCPPADEAMIHLAKEFKNHVYFLGYHVDYWDYIGWKDAFDSPDYTQRQNKYAETFGLNSIYTPQVIVNGRKELVGSREAELRRLIQDELKLPATASLQLKLERADSVVGLSYQIENVSGAVLNLALVQRMATSQVQRGENQGRKLEHVNIVRKLQSISIKNEHSGKTSLKVPAGLVAKDLKVIAFVQDARTMKIVCATGIELQ
jgi:hypothetical protein